MLLSRLAGDLGRIVGGADPDITGVSLDSRKVLPGALFAAMAGSREDGLRFVPDALSRGAIALLGDERVAALDLPLARVVSPDPRRALALLAARWHGLQPAVTVAVTGTSGKTSVVGFVRQLWSLLGHKAASLGTLGLIAPGMEQESGLTTPDPLELHAMLAELARAGVDHAAIEFSSHALDQRRVDGVRLSAAAFTNLSRDHYDYHGTEAAYLAAKLRLFEELLPAGGAIVVDADIEQYPLLAAIARARGLRLIDHGRAAQALRLLEQTPLPHGQRLRVAAGGHEFTIDSALVGTFQAANLLTAAGLALATGAEVGSVLPMLGLLHGAPGRMELVAQTRSGAAVFVDYAHKPGALEQALKALRPHARGRILVAFGCGGDRDTGKRPLMGEIAARNADLVIVTDDNPRTEDAALIRQAVMAGCPGAVEIGDRRRAIAHALSLLRAGDVLLVAGKGHETYQIIGTEKHPFDDAAVVRDLLAATGVA